MRRSREAKAESRDKIVAEARRAFLGRGVEGAALSEIMQAAGMTHGGFYKHFASKDDLLHAAVGAAFDALAERFDARHRAQGAEAAVKGYRADYLSADHIAHPGLGCPVAAIGAEAARLGGPLHGAYAEGAEALVGRLAAARGAADDPAARAAAIRDLAQMVGAVVIARALGPGAMRDEVLASVRDQTE